MRFSTSILDFQKFNFFDSAQATFWVQLCTVLACREFDSTRATTARSQIFREDLQGNKFLNKTILACLSGAQMDLIHEKNL